MTFFVTKVWKTFFYLLANEPTTHVNFRLIWSEPALLGCASQLSKEKTSDVRRERRERRKKVLQKALSPSLPLSTSNIHNLEYIGIGLFDTSFTKIPKYSLFPNLNFSSLKFQMICGKINF